MIYTKSLILPTFPIDGTFQTASTLFRISENQLLGRDFFSYLNVGISYILYPLFLILGKNYFATVVASRFAIFLIFLIVNLTSIIIVGSRKKDSLKIATLYSFVFYTLYNIRYVINVDLSFFDNILNTGASLRPIRVFPIFAYAMFFLVYKKNKDLNKNKLFILSLFNSFFVLLWPLDFGPITVFLAFMYSYIYIFERNITDTLKTIALSFLMLITFGYLSAKTYLLNFLDFQFLEIRKYQYWYFAPFDLDESYSFLDILFFENLILPLILFLFYCFLNFNNKNFKIFVFVSTSLFLGGLLPTIFGHPGDYFEYFKYFCYATFAFQILRIKTLKYVFRTYLTLLSLILIVLTNIYSFHIVSMLGHGIDRSIYDTHESFVEQYSKDFSDPWEKFDREDLKKQMNEYIYDSDLSGYIKKKYIPILQIDNNLVFEEYFSLHSAKKSNAFNVKTDSIIHMFGDQRTIASNLIKSKDFKIITNSNHNFYEWNLSFNWWFYEHLIENYVPNRVASNVLVWQKINNNYKSKEAWKKCKLENNFIKLDTTTEGLYSVKLTKNTLGDVVSVENNFFVPGYFNPTYNVNLDPNKLTVSFPFVTSNKTNSMKVTNNFNSILECDYKLILLENSQNFKTLKLQR